MFRRESNWSRFANIVENLSARSITDLLHSSNEKNK